jgi:hypothetical protein
MKLLGILYRLDFYNGCVVGLQQLSGKKYVLAFEAGFSAQ